MAKWSTKATTSITTVTSSAAIYVGDLENMVAEVSGITTGTVHVEVSVNGTTWVQVGSNLTANGRPDAAMPRASYARLRASIATTIAAVLTIGGDQAALQRPTYA